jgi:hypothetical protein
MHNELEYREGKGEKNKMLVSKKILKPKVYKHLENSRVPFV